MSLAPANGLVGTPIYNVYLRCLGSRIGRRAMIATGNVPVAADLFEVGEDAVIAKRVLATGYSAFGNRMHFGAIRIGAGAYVGEASVLDFGCSIGDFGQLGHASSLRNGQHLPAGKRYHGSPAEETATHFRLFHQRVEDRGRRALFTIGQLVAILLVAGPLVDAALTYALAIWANNVTGVALAAPLGRTARELLTPVFVGSLALFVVSMLVGLAAIYAAPRLAHIFLREGRVYPLFGFHHFLQRTVDGYSNSAFFNLLFGDSVYIERYLRFVGLRLARCRASRSALALATSGRTAF
jgi:non-ribosomal peptide synthetase-like protein